MDNQEQDQPLSRLYDTITQGESKTDLILPTCIILIGLTRVGKSTLFNWMNGKPLIGRQNESGFTNYYLVNENDRNAAELSDAQTSKTLIPNVCNVDNITRIDTAGFKDKRNHVGVFSVNCMLNFIFEKGQRCSFILVICKSQLGETSQGVMDTIYHFVSLFDYGSLDSETKIKLHNSVSLIITKTADEVKSEDKIIKNLKGIISNYKSPKHRYQKKEYCLEVLSNIVENQRIQFFKMAVENTNAPKCEIFQTLHIRGWTSFDLAKAKAKYPNILVNSFQKQFLSLSETDRTSYINIVECKIGGYNTVANIFQQVVQKIISCITESLIDYKQIFSRMTKYIAQFDEYTGVNNDISIKAKFNSMTFRKRGGSNQAIKDDTIKTMTKVKRVVELVSTIDKISQQITDDTKMMDILKQACVKIFVVIQQLCCRTLEEETTLINFAYIVLRGFNEFKVITKVDTFHWNSAHRKIYDYLISTSSLTIKQYKLEIIRNISKLTKQQKQAVFSKIEELAEYINFFQEYTNEYASQIDEETFQDLKRKSIQEKLLYCELMLQQGVDRYREILASSITMFQDLIEWRQNILNNLYQNHLSTGEVHNQKDIINFEQSFLSCVRILSYILIKKKQYALAINVLDTIEDSSTICECYELQLQSFFKKFRSPRKVVDSMQLQEIYINYADYCSAHGRFEKAIVIVQDYQKLISDCVKLRKMKQKVALYIRDRENNYDKYMNECQQEESRFLSMDRETLEALIEDIKIVDNLDLPMSASPNVSVNDSR